MKKYLLLLLALILVSANLIIFFPDHYNRLCLAFLGLGITYGYFAAYYRSIEMRDKVKKELEEKIKKFAEETQAKIDKELKENGLTLTIIVDSPENHFGSPN